MKSLGKKLIVLCFAGLLGAGSVISVSAPVTAAESAPAAKSSDSNKKASSVKVEIPDNARHTDDGWFAPRSPEITRPELPSTLEEAFVIPIRDGRDARPIDDTLYKIIKYKVTKARSMGAKLIIFDINTPGGSGKAMMDIMELLQNDLRDVYTVAYVNPDAYSAGAMIAMACTEIVVAPGCQLGVSTPIIIGGGGLETIGDAERAKIESGMRTKIRSVAKNRGHNPVLGEAMISYKMALWVIRSRKTRELKIVDSVHWVGKVAGAPDKPATGAAEWEFVRYFDTDQEVLALDKDEAMFCGLASGVFNDLDAVKKHYNIKTLVHLEDQPLDQVAIWLTSPAVAGLLSMVFILALFAELRSPGIGVPGAIAAIALFVIIGSRFLVGLANPIEVAMFAVGVILLIVEIFVIPGFGVAGISGMLLIVAAAVAMLVPNEPWTLPIPQVQADWDGLLHGLFAVTAGTILGGVVSYVLTANMPRLPIAKKMVLEDAHAADDAPRSDDSPMLAIAPGDQGVTVGPLRPVGQVRFGDVLLDAQSEGMLIDAGVIVSVLRRDGNRIIVEQSNQTPSADIESSPADEQGDTIEHEG